MTLPGGELTLEDRAGLRLRALAFNRYATDRHRDG